MRTGSRISKYIAVGAVVGLLLMGRVSIYAAAPGDKDLDAAINAGDFKEYFAGLSDWLSKKVPSDTNSITEAAMNVLFKDPVFANALAQRQFISKLGLENVAKFAKADQDSKAFLAWVMKDTQVMTLFLEGATPLSIRARDDNSWGLSLGALETWKNIYLADPDSRKDLYLRVAMACALAPPGTSARGAGQAATNATPLARFNHYKLAHKNNELVPSFDTLTVWELTKVVSCNATDADIAWGREAINTWRPDWRNEEKVVDSTTQVWRRNSPWPYSDYKKVLAGGGKCGPRSSWSVFICQAFGIPAVGVGQPAHACVAFRSHKDGCWQVAQGRGWSVSKLEGMGGNEFVECEAARSRPTFSQIEHLRWLASTLASKEQAAAVMGVARAVSLLRPAITRAQVKSFAVVPRPAEPVKAVPGVIHVDAASFDKMGGQTSYGNLQEEGVLVHDSYIGGKQIHFQAHMKSAWVDYKIDVPATAKYAFEMRVAAANEDQALDISSGTNKLATINMPLSYGLWETTKPVEIKLEKGPQTLRISSGFQRGVAVKWFKLKLLDK